MSKELAAASGLDAQYKPGWDELAIQWKDKIVRSGAMLYIAFAILIIFFGLMSPVFFSTGNLANVLRQTALVSIMAVGMTFVIVSGEFDLSVGSNLALSGVTAAMVIGATGVWYVGALAGISAGAGIGLVNGILTTKLRIPSFLITLGSLSIARGIAMVWTETHAVLIDDDAFFAVFGDGHVLGLSASIAWTIGVVLLGGVVLHLSVFGRKVFATGGNPQAARYSGIRVDRIKIASLVIVGALAGLAGLVLAARSHAARPDVAAGLELDVITAVILGGAALSGGRGTMQGAIIGSLIIGILNNGLVLIGIDPSVQLALKGLIIWVSVTLSRR